LFLRLIGVRGLLCDNCNYPFRAFSLLPPKSHRSNHTQRNADVFNPAPVIDLTQIRQNPAMGKPEPQAVTPRAEKHELRVGTSAMEQFQFAGSSTSPVPTAARVVTNYIAPARSDLRTEITKIHAQRNKEQAAAPPRPPAPPTPKLSSQTCPECNSRN